MSVKPAILWFRRDLRLNDNLALTAAVSESRPVVCIYIRESGDRDAGANGGAQAWWLFHSLQALDRDLRNRGNRLLIFTGNPIEVIKGIIAKTGADSVFWNRRYDRQGIETDAAIKADLGKNGLSGRSFSGFLLHEPSKLGTGQGRPYSVYTPFWRALESGYVPLDPLPAPGAIVAPAIEINSDHLVDWKLLPEKPNWASRFAEIWLPGEAGAAERLSAFIARGLDGYKSKRDFPAGHYTSCLSPHLAFGEITPDRIWRATLTSAVPGLDEDRLHFRKEIVWREFSWHLMFHGRDIARQNINRRFDAFPWKSDSAALRLWQEGMTGYPIVDAGMRQLRAHGWMHNRVRMVAASFLIKHLLIDWREGETWFRDTLVDADLASNAASWQWVAGSGADAAPYFRIFNPIKQGETFDPDGHYVREFCPELKNLPNRYIHRPFEAPEDLLQTACIKLGETYPMPIVKHDFARNRALAAYQTIKSC
jgi:deoxyribodipyrimidine photo-lyase